MSILKVSIRQVKAGRALIGWSQKDLAERCGVSEPTIKRLESEADEAPLGGRQDTANKIRAAFEAAGLIFLSEGQVSSDGVGVRLVASPAERLRALAVEAGRAVQAGSEGASDALARLAAEGVCLGLPIAEAARIAAEGLEAGRAGE